MTRSFLDSSALIKYYHDEESSLTVKRMLMELHFERLIARLTWVEILSGLAKRVRIAEIPPELRSVGASSIPS